jgi:NAD(P)-dependent dehydrogenase (short-subunit alcohol dehydrogenase family)
MEVRMSVLSSFALDGRVAIVTGGKRGIGKAIALALAEAGADVAVCSRALDDGRLEATAEEIRQLGRRSLAIQADVRERASIEEMVARVVAEFGTIDIMVNNAGVQVEVPLIEVKEEDWDFIHSTNLKGCLFCCQEVSRVMVKQKRGNIINIASIGGLRPCLNLGGYDTSKAGVIMLTQSLASELARDNIRINTICPGYIMTEMNQYLLDNPDLLRMTETSILLGRWAEPREIAAVAVFLASDASSYMTGSAVVVDGGFTQTPTP